MGELVETEVKIWVADLSAVLPRLEAVGARLVQARVYERNVRYENAAGTFTAEGIVLRLRQDTRTRLTYKAPLSPDPARSAVVAARFEAEVTVDDFGVMDVILQRLGFRPHVVYEKYRAAYRLGEAEVALDEMPFGHFIEVEGPAPAIEAALSALELGSAPRILESYLVLFERVKTALGLDVHDLTFANFAGVRVPPDVFGGVG